MRQPRSCSMWFRSRCAVKAHHTVQHTPRCRRPGATPRCMRQRLPSAWRPARVSQRWVCHPCLCQLCVVWSLCQDVDSKCSVMLDGRELEKAARTQVGGTHCTGCHRGTTVVVVTGKPGKHAPQTAAVGDSGRMLCSPLVCTHKSPLQCRGCIPTIGRTSPCMQVRPGACLGLGQEAQYIVLRNVFAHA